MNSAEKLILLNQRPSTSHLLHLVISLFTAGAWVPVWIIIALINQQRCANIMRKIKRG